MYGWFCVSTLTMSRYRWQQSIDPSAGCLAENFLHGLEDFLVLVSHIGLVHIINATAKSLLEHGLDTVQLLLGNMVLAALHLYMIRM